MKILHVIRDLSRATGGPVNALKGLAEAQAALGHEVAILAIDVGGDNVIPVSASVHLVRARHNVCFWAPEIKELLEMLVPRSDIVHAHMVWDYPIWEASRQARRFGKPFILRPCGNLETWSLSQKRLKKMIYLRSFGSVVHSAAAIHYTSESERAGSVAVTRDHGSVIIPLGVLPEIAERVNAGNFVRRFSELHDKRIVLFLGRLHPKKRPELVIDAFSTIAGEDQRRHLVLAGPAEEAYRVSLLTRVQRKGIAERVTFTGLLGPEDVREAIAAADVFVLPSQQENFGISVVEAMAGGCPVVISDRIGIVPEILAEDAGIVCPMQPASIADALRRILDDDALRRRMGENGRNLVLSRYTWPRVADEVLETYSKLITAPGVDFHPELTRPWSEPPRLDQGHGKTNTFCGP